MLFDWLLEQINDWLSPTEMDSCVGVVDFYGFEVSIALEPVFFQNVNLNFPLHGSGFTDALFSLQDLVMNSFEQLCINFANEKLQHFVNKAVISQELVSACGRN